MPSLDAANITFNVLKAAAGEGITVGPILLGAAKPVHVLTPTSTVRRIVNMTALTAVDAESALALLAGVAVDLVILDAVLPGLSGIAAYRTIHQRHPSARVLVVSGYVLWRRRVA